MGNLVLAAEDLGKSVISYVTADDKGPPVRGSEGQLAQSYVT